MDLTTIYIVLLFLFGMTGGFLAGYMAVGGGLIYVLIIPVVLNYYQFPEEVIPQYTIANSVFAILFASAAANIRNFKSKDFYIKPFLFTGTGGIIASLLTLTEIVNTPFYDQKVFNLIVISLLIFIMIRMVRKTYNQEFKEVDIADINSLQWFFTGFAGGIIAALSGFGGGIIIIPLLTQVLKINIRKAHIISMNVIFLMALFMTLLNLNADTAYTPALFHVGNIIFTIAIPLSAGVLIMSPLGVKAASKSKENRIRIIFVIFILVVIIKKGWELYN